MLNQVGEIAKIGGWEMDLEKGGKATWTKGTYDIAEIVPGDPIPGADEHLGWYLPEYRAMIEKKMKDLVETREPMRFEAMLKTKKGTLKWCQAIGEAVEEDGKVVKLRGTYQDITEKTKLEQQYRQAQKVESIGRLAGGVAHDLNNLLSPILGYSELLKDDLEPGGKHRGFVNQILEAGFRARDLVRQLLAFGRKQTLEYKPVDMNKVVTGFENLLRRTIREDIETRIIPSPHIPVVMADPGQIEQVIMNLVVNAADAMPDGGLLTIETAQADLDEEYAARHPGVKPDAYVMLAVSDTGCGMNDEIREHLFEPFFSTKGDQGTGLGLATVYGIIKQHGGNIWIYSEPGRGTTFKIYLPVSGDVRAEETRSAKTTGNLEGTETILLVEDNEQVRHLTHAILTRKGYTVLMAGDGSEALTVLESFDGPVHLLLTDVVMPEMNGKELFIKASEKHPGLKVLYMSGYTDNVIAHRGILDEGMAFVQKPFTVRALSVEVRKVLDQELEGKSFRSTGRQKRLHT